MSANETMNVSETGASKAGNLERHSLLAPSLRELAEHYGRGSLKYDDHNWRKGMNWSLLFDAMMRHAWSFWNGEDFDAETGSKHIIAVAWHALSLATYMDEHRDLDDRPMAPVKISSPFEIVDTMDDRPRPPASAMDLDDPRHDANVVPVDDESEHWDIGPLRVVEFDDDDGETHGRHALGMSAVAWRPGGVPEVVFWNAGHFARLVWRRPDYPPDPGEPEWVPILQEVYAGE
jgi:hypothetical protein